MRRPLHRSSPISLEDASRQPREAWVRRHADPVVVGWRPHRHPGRFFDQKEVKERAAGSISAHARGVPISAEECFRNPRAELRDKLIPPSFVHRHGAHAFPVTQRCADIVDRSKKTSDVTEWTGLGAPFRNRCGRLTFEIDDESRRRQPELGQDENPHAHES